MSSTNTNTSLQSLRELVIAKGNVSGTNCYVSKAAGAMITDVQGQEYIDFSGGIAVMNVGHSHPMVVEAIKRQAERFTHTCFMVVPYAQAVTLAEKLCAAVPGDFPKAAMFANSGAEAVENAVKIARYATKKQAIIAFEHAFHGRTLMGMSLTAKSMPYKFGFGPFAPEVYRAPFAYCYRCPINLEYPKCDVACAHYVQGLIDKQLMPEHTAAVIAEPVLGEGGFIAPPQEYFAKIKAICEARDVLFIADEIQTGIGRTGTMFAMEQFGVAPDITTTAKSLAAGMPLSAVVGKKEIMDTVHPGGIGGTYGGNPVACAAALAVLEIFEKEDLLVRSKTLGEKLRTCLVEYQEQFEIIGDLRGMGSMMAMELVTDRRTKAPAADETKWLTTYCFERGLILLSCGTYGNVVRFLMPLVITDEQLDKGLAIVADGLKAINNKE
jgi:4-aminobutyrate aminotransferase / (S)-3-amino-2-methylpropionate transaminase / 5-aminovalerate transaminase